MTETTDRTIPTVQDWALALLRYLLASQVAFLLLRNAYVAQGGNVEQWPEVWAELTKVVQV